MPPTTVSTLYDDAAHAYASTLLEQTGGLWLGMWGAWSRKLWAFYCGPAEHGVCIGATDPTELAHQMEAAEEHLRYGLTFKPPGPALRGVQGAG